MTNHWTLNPRFLCIRPERASEPNRVIANILWSRVLWSVYFNKLYVYRKRIPFVWWPLQSSLTTELAHNSTTCRMGRRCASGLSNCIHAPRGVPHLHYCYLRDCSEKITGRGRGDREFYVSHWPNLGTSPSSAFGTNLDTSFIFQYACSFFQKDATLPWYSQIRILPHFGDIPKSGSTPPCKQMQ